MRVRWVLSISRSFPSPRTGLDCSSGTMRCRQPRSALHQLHRLLHRMPHPRPKAQEDADRQGSGLAEVSPLPSPHLRSTSDINPEARRATPTTDPPRLPTTPTPSPPPALNPAIRRPSTTPPMAPPRPQCPQPMPPNKLPTMAPMCNS